MLPYPNIDPVAFRFGFLKVHWYGLMYLLGFFLAWLVACYRGKRCQPAWQQEEVSDLIFYGAMGVVLGGRIGYMLFYAFPILRADPLQLFYIWQGGMSFHGGLLGVSLALLLYAGRSKRSFMEIMDFMAPLVPLGLATGRIGNFINGELWGRVTDVPWAMVFPRAGYLPRHPSQLYEFALEGVLLFLILFFYSRKPRPRMAVSGMFLLFYGVFRIIAECFRQPDPQLSFIAFGWLTMGQLLSVPMVLFGVGIMVLAYQRKHERSG